MFAYQIFVLIVFKFRLLSARLFLELKKKTTLRIFIDVLKQRIEFPCDLISNLIILFL